ncbi:MAG: hypothetical protein JSW58_03635 [Candidatus Latescibacterota bacterium]|nr:MAG: hypothetical protein JSW58_03635 [Candidatus Latescibacterota bacterium]
MRSLNGLRWFAITTICLAAAGLVACLLTNADADEKIYKLEYKLKKGTAFGMKTTIERKSVREMMGNEIKSTTMDIVVYDAKVTEAKGGTATIEVTYEDRSHETDDPQVQLDVDFSSLLGKTVQFSVTSLGELSEFAGFDALPELAISGGQTHGESQYINELKEFFIRLSEDKIAVGETWSYTEEFNEPVEGGGAKVVVDYTYTLAEVAEKNGHDCLKLTGESTTKVTGKGVEQGMEYTITLGGKGSETAWFAYKRGMLLETETVSFLEGAVVAEDVGFEMPMRNDYTSKRTFALK